MRALRMTAWGRPPELCEVPVPEPGPGEVLIRMAAAGACHSDLHLMDRAPGELPYRLPFTLGHENAGWIAATGAGVSGWGAGDAVAIYGPWGCGRCRACRASRENHCLRLDELGARGGGLGRDGGMAEYLLVPSPRLLVALENLDPIEAAPLTDAGLTAYHAIASARDLLRPGATAVVIGVGGLGHMAVQILRATSPASVVAVDRAAEKLALALSLGAHEAIQAGSGTVGAVRELTAGSGAEVVLDFVGTGETMGQAVAMAAVAGHVALVGLAGGAVAVSPRELPRGLRVSVSFWGSAVELEELLALARMGQIRTRVETVGLDDAPALYECLRAGEVEGRAVVTPGV